MDVRLQLTEILKTRIAPSVPWYAASQWSNAIWQTNAVITFNRLHRTELIIRASAKYT